MSERDVRSPVDERRSSERTYQQRPMSLTLEGAVVEGRSRDLSDSSVFFLADSELHMGVRFEDEGGSVRHGRLVRYQRMPSGGSGWAIEFDD